MPIDDLQTKGDLRRFVEQIRQRPSPKVSVPQARIRRGTNLTVTTNTFTAVPFDTETYDLGTPTEQHSTSVNTSRLTCRVPGLYNICANFFWDSNPTGARETRIRLNGTTAIARDYVSAPAGGGYYLGALPTQYRLAAGDYIEMLVYHEKGSDLLHVAEGVWSPVLAWHWASP